jgi:protease IV
VSFKRISAILRSNWLIDKQWANSHMPLILNFLKGDTAAISAIIGNKNSSNENNNENDAAYLVGGTNNVYEVYCRTDLSKVPNGSIAYLDIDGPMFKQGDFCSAGMEDYVMLINGIQKAANISALIIDIDTPGGQANGPASLTDAIKKCDAVKPVIGFVNDGYCASAGYYFLSGCREIYVCQETTQVGSIGTYCTIADWNAYYISQGLPIKDVYAPQSIDKNQEYIQSVAGNDDLLKADLEVITTAFINTVKQNRKGKIVGTDWAGGKLYFAKDALQIGLIDGIKTFDQVIFRTSRLISSQKNNSTIMAFEKTLQAAAATEFAVTNDGFLVSETELNNIEATLENNVVNAEALEQANNSITEKNNRIIELESDNSAEEYEATLATKNAEIVKLQEQLAVFTSKASGTGTALKVDEDAIVVEATKKVLSINDENRSKKKSCCKSK